MNTMHLKTALEDAHGAYDEHILPCFALLYRSPGSLTFPACKGTATPPLKYSKLGASASVSLH
jgi:hypothetical protein